MGVTSTVMAHGLAAFAWKNERLQKLVLQLCKCVRGMTLVCDTLAIMP